MTDTIRWGILGASHFALTQMAPAIQLAHGASLAAVATRSPAKADPFRALAPGVTIHDGYEALLADPGVDAVYIPLPHPMHVEWSLKALEAGKHVLVEKPLAMEAAGIDPLIARRDATGLTCAEAYMIVHHPQWKRARAMLREGRIGDLVHVIGAFTYDNSDDPQNIRNRKETGGGALPDIGVYTYGSTRWMTGEEPGEIIRADIDFENGVDTVARISARFPSFTAHFLNSMRMAPRQSMEFHGTEGVIRLTTPFNTNVFGMAEVELARGTERLLERFPSANQYLLQVEAFGRSIREGTPFAWSLEDARGTQAMIDAVYAAAGPG